MSRISTLGDLNEFFVKLQMANIEIPENIILDLTRDEKIQLVESQFPVRGKIRVGGSLRLESLTTQFGTIKIQ